MLTGDLPDMSGITGYEYVETWKLQILKSVVGKAGKFKKVLDLMSSGALMAMCTRGEI